MSKANIGDKVMIYTHTWRGDVFQGLGEIEKITPAGKYKVNGVLYKEPPYQTNVIGNGIGEAKGWYIVPYSEREMKELKRKKLHEIMYGKIQDFFSLYSNMDNISYESLKQIYQILEKEGVVDNGKPQAL